MAINYAKLFNRRSTPQSQPIPGSTQVRNTGGGHAWPVDDWVRLDRFLILGAEGGTRRVHRLSTTWCSAGCSRVPPRLVNAK